MQTRSKASRTRLAKKVSTQKERFIHAAKKAEASDDPEVFERIFSKIVPPKRKRVLFGKPADKKR